MPLSEEFEKAMYEIYRRAATEINYRPKAFLEMLTMKGGVQTARTLINAPMQSEGFTRLYDEGRLDLSVEAVVVLNVRFHSLFTQAEIERARNRLIEVNYPLDKS